jgi:GTP cyclohydrolase II
MEISHDRSIALSSQGRALRRRHTSSTRSLDRSTNSLVDQSSQPETHRADRPIEERARGVRPAGPRVRATVTIPIRDGILARFVTFDDLADRGEHFALCFGDTATHGAAPLVRLHSECITGDVFGSLRCDCGAQLDRSIQMLDERGGILLYLRQEGRGLGLLAKLDAYRLQDLGLDTFDANRALLHPADARNYVCGAEMLRALGVASVRLITNNPDKVTQLRQAGIEIAERVPAGTFLTPFNRSYLLAKARRAGHSLDL